MKGEYSDGEQGKVQRSKKLDKGPKHLRCVGHAGTSDVGGRKEEDKSLFGLKRLQGTASIKLYYTKEVIWYTHEKFLFPFKSFPDYIYSGEATTKTPSDP
jgi:hypothetical protein